MLKAEGAPEMIIDEPSVSRLGRFDARVALGAAVIAVEVVSKEKFDAWIEKAKKEFAADDGPALRKFAKNETK